MTVAFFVFVILLSLGLAMYGAYVWLCAWLDRKPEHEPEHRHVRVLVDWTEPYDWEVRT